VAGEARERDPPPVRRDVDVELVRLRPGDLRERPSGGPDGGHVGHAVVDVADERDAAVARPRLGCRARPERCPRGRARRGVVLARLLGLGVTRVGSTAAVGAVVIRLPQQEVVAVQTFEHVVASATGERVVAVVSAENVGVVGADRGLYPDELVRAFAGRGAPAEVDRHALGRVVVRHDVPAVPSVEQVVACSSREEVTRSAAERARREPPQGVVAGLPDQQVRRVVAGQDVVEVRSDEPLDGDQNV
jgi:hypothetical protein